MKASQLDMVSLLIEKEAKIEAADRDSLTSLHWSAKNGHLAIIELLLQSGANIEAKTSIRLNGLQCYEVEIS